MAETQLPKAETQLPKAETQLPKAVRLVLGELDMFFRFKKNGDVESYKEMYADCLESLKEQRKRNEWALLKACFNVLFSTHYKKPLELILGKLDINELALYLNGYFRVEDGVVSVEYVADEVAYRITTNLPNGSELTFTYTRETEEDQLQEFKKHALTCLIFNEVNLTLCLFH